MKLCKLYCSDSKFKDVIFHPNFNVVLGEITDETFLNNDSHNLGKSTLISLIDFMLLKGVDKNHFLKKAVFKEYVFYLEIKLNNGQYVTIKRPVDKNTKISLKLHNIEDLDARNGINWDYEELSLYSQDKSLNPKDILNDWLAFDVLEGEDYRKTSGYFLRTQDDYLDVFKLQKYKGKDSDWKPVLFELLGFNSEHMRKKYSLEYQIACKEKFIEDIQEQLSVDSGEKDRLNGLIDIAEQKRDQIRNWLDNFDFYQKEINLDKEVIEEVETAISKYNTKRYNLEYELQQINESLNVDVTFDLKEMLRLYDEVGIYFSDQVVKEYEELVEFNKQLSSERKKYLKQSQEKKEAQLKDVNVKLIEFNEKRQLLLGNLAETDTFNKYKNYRDELIEVEYEIAHYVNELERIDSVKTIKNQIRQLEEDLRKETSILSKQIEESTDIYKRIRKDFHEYVKEILDSKAIIDLKENSNQNIDFNACFYDSNDIKTAQDSGHTYKKLLCACFDLAVVKNYMDRSFFRFIYHDGCLESLDPRKQKKYLDLVRKVSEEHNIQYILTCLSSEIPHGDKYKIKDDEVAVTLSDAEDNSGKLFGFEF